MAMKVKNHGNALPEITSQRAESHVAKARRIHAKYGVWTN